MEEYWKARTQLHPSAPPSSPVDLDDDETFLSAFDRHRTALLSHGIDEDWRVELRRYLQDIPSDVT